MNPILGYVLTALINLILEKILKPEVLGNAETMLKKAIIECLAKLAKQSPTEIDDKMVAALAKAWNIPYPVA